MRGRLTQVTRPDLKTVGYGYGYGYDAAGNQWTEESGVFETTVNAGTETVRVRGNVIDGVAKIGTALKQ